MGTNYDLPLLARPDLTRFSFVRLLLAAQVMLPGLFPTSGPS